MVFYARSYRMLVVSASEKFNTSLRAILTQSSDCIPTFVPGVAAAKHALADSGFDMVLINAPLPDDPGVHFAIDVSSLRDIVCLLLVRDEQYEEARARVVDHGVFTLQKPLSAAMLTQGVEWLQAARERIRRMEQETTSIEEKMDEIRLVNRAKWLLIEKEKMTEANAHRLIERRAMERCASRREIAHEIVQQYSRLKTRDG